MFVRLNRKQRVKSGWLAALIYTLCIVAPTLSCALPDGQAAGPCASLHDAMAALPHNATLVSAIGEETSHDHSMHGDIPGSDAHDMSAMADDDMSSRSGHAKTSPHTASGQCCALMCVGGLPTVLHEITLPTAHAVATVFAVRCMSAGPAPSVNYRPPIA